MTMISFASAHPMVVSGDRSLVAITLFCGCGLTTALSALALGIDLSTACV
jgi:hypothetical protein